MLITKPRTFREPRRNHRRPSTARSAEGPPAGVGEILEPIDGTDRVPIPVPPAIARGSPAAPPSPRKPSGRPSFRSGDGDRAASPAAGPSIRHLDAALPSHPDAPGDAAVPPCGNRGSPPRHEGTEGLHRSLPGGAAGPETPRKRPNPIHEEMPCNSIFTKRIMA